MIDPMADISDDPGLHMAGENAHQARDVFDIMVMQANLQRINRIRSVMGIVSGCVTGVAGVTGWKGLVVFLALHVFICLTIWASKMKFNLRAYTKQSWFQYLTTQLEPTALSFTLFWTLFYGLVYLY